MCTSSQTSFSKVIPREAICLSFLVRKGFCCHLPVNVKQSNSQTRIDGVTIKSTYFICIYTIELIYLRNPHPACIALPWTGSVILGVEQSCLVFVGEAKHAVLRGLSNPINRGEETSIPLKLFKTDVVLHVINFSQGVTKNAFKVWDGFQIFINSLYRRKLLGSF